MNRVLLAAVLLLAGCSSAAEVERADAGSLCPSWQTEVRGADGGHHCRIPGDFVNVTPGCHPIACAIYARWSRDGDGGAAALACAGACESFCADDPLEEAKNLAEAASLGLSCEY